MSAPVRRRPLPALIGLLALTLLTALVWWRVANRSTHAAGPTCAPTPTQTALPAPSSVSVSVLNSTPRTGIAKAAYLTLQADGFTMNIYGNDTGQPVLAGIAEIRFGPDQKPAAALLSFYFPGATLAPRDTVAAERDRLAGAQVHRGSQRPGGVRGDAQGGGVGRAVRFPGPATGRHLLSG